jgi:uncharacterized protein YutE (UPF0331/DUF86 family)
MVEHCVDIANHIISDRELPIPTSYANTFEILNQASLISDDLTKTMVRVVKFSNILVHQYTQVDAAIVVSILQSNLIDFIRFRDEIASSMKQG